MKPNVRELTAEEIDCWTDAERLEYEEALQAPAAYRDLVVGAVVTKNRAAHAHGHWPQDEIAIEIRKQTRNGRDLVPFMRELLQDPSTTDEDRRELEARLQWMRENGIVVDDA